MKKMTDDKRKTARRLRRFIIKWAIENYGLTPTNPPATNEIETVLRNKRGPK